MASGLAGLAPKAIPLQEAEVLGLLGVAERRDDIRQCTLATSLVPNNGDKIGVQQDVTAMQPPPNASLVPCFGDLDRLDVEGLVGLDFLNLGRLVTNEGAFRWLKNGLLEAVERRVGFDPRPFPGGEVAIAPLVVVARCSNEAVGVAS